MHPVATSGEILDFSGKPPVTVARSSTLFASLVGLFLYMRIFPPQLCFLIQSEHVLVFDWCFLESGRSLACAEHNATLQCGSGQVIEIDDSFYGRKAVHYCRSSHAPSQASPQQEECSWVDIVDTVSGTSSETFPLLYDTFHEQVTLWCVIILTKLNLN